MLTLPITRYWFDKIVSGTKKEEYRECTPYYSARFERHLGSCISVVIRAGYSQKSPMALLNVIINKGTGKPEWGASDGQTYYVLTIININAIK